MAIYIGDNEAELLPIDATQSQEVVCAMLWCMISDINICRVNEVVEIVRR